MSFARFFPRTKKASGREDLGFELVFGLDPGRDGREITGPREGGPLPKIEGVEEKLLAPVSFESSDKSLLQKIEDEEQEEEEKEEEDNKERDLLLRGMNP